MEIVETVTTALSRFQAGEIPRPRVYWYLSWHCNLSCAHCLVNSSPSVSTALNLSSEQAGEVAVCLAALQPETVIPTGGEPLLRPYFRRIFHTLNDAGVRVDIETNGTLVSSEIAAELAAAGKRAPVGVHISVDGGTAKANDRIRGAGMFALTAKGIQRLNAVGISPQIQCCLTKTNVESVPQFRSLRDELEVSLLKFVLLTPKGRAQDNRDSLAFTTYDEYRHAFKLIDALTEEDERPVLLKLPAAVIPPELFIRFRQRPHVVIATSCPFPMLGIGPDGRVTICALTRETDVQFGHALAVDFERIWLSPRMRDLQAKYFNAELEGICAECVFRTTCRGSCRAIAYPDSGSFQSPYPLCSLFAQRGWFPKVYRTSEFSGFPS